MFTIKDILENYPFYQVLIYGLAAGLSGCGFYDVIKAIGGLFKNKTPRYQTWFQMSCYLLCSSNGYDLLWLFDV